MNKTFKDLKEISQGLADLVGVTYDEAARIVASFSSIGKWGEVDKIAAGDMETIREGAASVGVALPESEKVPKRSRQAEKRPTNQKNIKADQYKTQRDIIKPSIERITPEAVEIVNKYNDVDYVRGELPPGLADDIKHFLELWAQDNNIEDLSKCASLQWRAACIYCGWWIRDKGILFDREAMARSVGGSRVYDAEKVSKLLDIFQALSSVYRHIPLHTDFISFSGVSREWFFDYDGRGLTSANAQIIKKAMEIENAAISAGVTDSRENPTGRIFYAKARLGWREADQVAPIHDENRQAAAALPVFDVVSGRLIAEKS